MTIQDYILSYKVNNEIVCNLFDYYDRFIKPLKPEFQKYSLGTSKLVLCWFKDHEDVNPSMGFINDRHHKGGKIYHCFGCGRTGNVIRLHQIIQAQYYDKKITEEEACKELAQLFNIPLGEYDEYTEEDYEKRFVEKLKREDELAKRYTLADYTLNIRKIRGSDMPLEKKADKINSECIKLIASTKFLYNN